MDISSPDAAIEKALAQLANLGISFHMQGGEHAAAQVQGHGRTEDANGDGNVDTDMNKDTDIDAHPYTDAGGDEGKGKAVAEPSGSSLPEVEAEAKDDDEEEDAALTRAISTSLTQDNSQHHESSSSAGISNEPGKIVQHPPDDSPIPDLWPAPIPANEAALLNMEDSRGPMLVTTYPKLSTSEDNSFLLSTPPTSPHYPAAHYLLSVAFREDFCRTLDTRALAEAFWHARVAVSLLALPRIIRSMAIRNLAEIHNLSWLHTRRLSDISAAVELLERTLDVMAMTDPERIPITSFLSDMYSQRYNALRKPVDLEGYIFLPQEMAAIQPAATLRAYAQQTPEKRNMEMPTEHLELGKRLYHRGSIDRSIEQFQLAMALSGEDSDLQAEALEGLVKVMWLRNPNDHAGILAAMRKGIQALPESHPKIVYFRWRISMLAGMDEVERLRAVVDSSGGGGVGALADLSEGLLARFLQRGDAKDLDDFFEPAVIALAGTECTEKAYVRRCMFLAEALRIRYEMHGDRPDIDRCIETWEKALDVAEGEQLLEVQTTMSYALYIRHKHGSNAADVDRALKLAKAASDATREDHSEYAGRLLNLGNTYMGRFRVYSIKADIDTGISTLHRALKASKNEDSRIDVPGLMGNLAMQLLERDDKFRQQPSDLTEAAKYAEMSMKMTPRGTQLHLERVLNLATILDNRSEEGDLERSFYLTRSALMKIPKGHRIIPATMMALAMRINRLYGRGNVEGLNAAVAVTEQAAAATTVGHPDRARVLSSLAMVYRERYERMGNLTDLERAVKNGYASVASAEDLTAMKGFYISVLSELLGLRHRRLGAMGDLELSVTTAREALDCTPLGHRYRPQRVIELCERYLERYKTCGKQDDIFSAIALGELCLKMTSKKGEKLCRQHYIVAEAFYQRHCDFNLFWRDLDRALSLAHDAWTLFQSDKQLDITKPEIAHLLGRLMYTMYRRDREMLAIHGAIHFLEGAAIEINDEHPNRAEILNTLAQCYLIRYQALGNTGPDGERSFVTFRDAWESATAPPLIRIRAAAQVGDALIRSKRWDEAAEIVEECVKLMPRVTPPSLTRADQEALIKMLSEVPLVAANAALEAGRGAERALRLLELGRGIIRGFTMDCRSDMSDLGTAHPELYQKFNLLRRELDNAVRAPQGREELAEQPAYLGEEGRLARRKEALEQFEEYLAKIRSLEGYENFLLPPTGEELRRMAAEGPIVVFNCWKEHCQAILVTTESIRSIKLSRWQREEAEKRIWNHTNEHIRGSVRMYHERNKKVKVTMKWLWNVVVNPVLTELGITQATGGDGGVLPEIWWVGSGPLNFVPFHAAGIHTPGSKQNTISRVISSYIPSIKALTYARQKRPSASTSASTSPPSILIITMPTTPGYGDLGGVNAEANHIKSVVGSTHTCKILPYPTASEVLGQISSHRAVHFACHGITDKINPSNGALLLGKEDGSLSRLNVHMIADIWMEAAEIAYLSACETARNTIQELAEETIHLAGAFMLAGFRNVVATLWEGNDEACKKVASEYYRGVFVEGLGSGKALHRAVVTLRAIRPDLVLRWAPFIHTGA